MRIMSVAASLALSAGIVVGPIASVGAMDPEWSTRLGIKATTLTEQEMSDQRGAGLSPALAALLAALPSGNTVAVQIGDNPSEGGSGAGPHTITVTRGGSTGTASASSSGATSVSTGVTSSCCAGFLRTNSFSRSRSFGARF